MYLPFLLQRHSEGLTHALTPFVCLQAMTKRSGEVEAVRCLGQSEVHLRRRELAACRALALRAQKTQPNLVDAAKVLAIADVLSAVGDPQRGGALDLYAVLQVDPRRDDSEIIRLRFKKLETLLNPKWNRFPFAGEASGLVDQAWSLVSGDSKRARYEQHLSQRELPQRSPKKKEPKGSASACGGGDDGEGGGTFWTVCPYCYYLHEYAEIYEDCCLRCQNCKRAFQGVPVASPPPPIPGKNEYFCCIGRFPLGFMDPESCNGDDNEEKKDEFVIEVSDDSEEEEVENPENGETEQVKMETGSLNLNTDTVEAEKDAKGQGMNGNQITNENGVNGNGSASKLLGRNRRTKAMTKFTNKITGTGKRRPIVGGALAVENPDVHADKLVEMTDFEKNEEMSGESSSDWSDC